MFKIKKINFKKSWSYLFILGILFTLLLMFMLCVDLVPDSVLDQVVGNILGYDFTFRQLYLVMAMYYALTLITLFFVSIVKWCIKHIIFE